MSDPLYDKFPRHLNPNFPENGITRPQALGGLMRVFYQGHKAGEDGVDSKAIEQAANQVYKNNAAYSHAYIAGYTYGRDGYDVDEAVEDYLLKEEKRK